MKSIIILLFLAFIAFGKESTKTVDSSVVTGSIINKIDSTFDFKLTIYSIGGEQSTESIENIEIIKNNVKYYDNKNQILINNDTILVRNLLLILSKLENYKNEYNNGGLMILDGTFTRIEIWDNKKLMKYKVEANDIDCSYYNLCLIYEKINDVLYVFKDENTKKLLKYIKEHNSFPCSKINEVNKK